MQDDLVRLQPGFKTELLHSVEVFKTDVDDFGTNYEVVSRASTFTKFCKHLHESKKLKRFRLHASTVLIFFPLSQIGKIVNIFPKKNSLKNVLFVKIDQRHMYIQ